jgi:hypothetical protein
MKNIITSSLVALACVAMPWAAFARDTTSAGSTSIAIDEPAQEVRCSDILGYYREMLAEPQSIIPADLNAQITAILDGAGSCEAKNQAVSALLDAFYATDPWCQVDRANWLNLVSFAALSVEQKTVVDDLLGSTVVPCRDGLYAAQTIVRHYDPSQTLETWYGPVEIFAEDIASQSGIAGAIKNEIKKVKKRKKACRNGSKKNRK